MPSVAAVTLGQYLGVAMILLLSMNQILKTAGEVSTTRTSVHSVKMVPRSSQEMRTLLSVKWKCM